MGTRAITVIGASLVVACVEPRTTHCGDLICPVGKICDEAHGACVLPAQLDVCEGRPDGEACAYPGEDRGACNLGTCLAVECGDGRRELDEACDDANNTGGDGCSADCSSDERCGNGVVDESHGEECDQLGDFRNHDGCSSECKVELPSWSEVSTGIPRGPQRHRAAYDSGRGRVVVFGGVTPTDDPMSSTFEYTGTQWLRAQTATRPTGREGHVLVYDAARRRIVMFGGNQQELLSNETWEYDGDDWRRIMPATSPSRRTDAAAAWDAARGRVVLFGGETAAGLSGETWEYDGTQWTARMGPQPPARAGHVMAYDAARGRVVLFGGSGAGGPLTDTWEWDGAAWVDATPPTIPTARGTMAYDAGRARVVMFGGSEATSDETWEYDGVDWIQIATAASPPARKDTAMAYDAGRRRMVVFCGGIGLTGSVYEDTWEYDGTTWIEAPYTVDPPKRIFAGFAYDEWRARMVVYGGFFPPTMTSRADTWWYDGLQWIDARPEESPVPRPPPPPMPGIPLPYDTPNALVFDSVRGRMIAVREDDADPAGPLETWAYDGATWTLLALPAAPPSRQFQMMAYDSARDRVVLYGGQEGTTLFGDTWELDGATWTEVTPPGSPPPRADAVMAYDAGRARVVLFGGRAEGGTFLDDTWVYDGTAWTELTPATRPPARQSSTMAYDPTRGRLVIFGGEHPPTPFTDVWELDETDWTQLQPSMGPFPRKTPRMAYDPRRKLLVMHGGDPRQDTWELQYRSETPDEVCSGGVDDDRDSLVDCGDPDCEEVSCGPGASVCRGGSCVCAGGATETRCGDSFDDDCDGSSDCNDADCAGDERCARETACGDGMDDDGDGAIDCADLDCFLIACGVLP